MTWRARSVGYRAGAGPPAAMLAKMRGPHELARQGAGAPLEHSRGRARPRAARHGLTRGLLLALLAVVPGCGAVDFLNDLSEDRLDLGRMEGDIRSQMQRRLESDARTTRGSVASVGRVRCRQRSELEASCFARVSQDGRRRLRRILVSIDSRTGRYTWEIVR